MNNVTNYQIENLIALNATSLTSFYLTFVAIFYNCRQRKKRKLEIVNRLCFIMTFLEFFDCITLHVEFFMPKSSYQKFCRSKILINTIFGLTTRVLSGFIFYFQASLFYTSYIIVGESWKQRVKYLLYGGIACSIALFISLMVIWIPSTDMKCLKGYTTEVEKIITLTFFCGVCVFHLISFLTIVKPVFDKWLKDRNKPISNINRLKRFKSIRVVLIRMCICCLVIVITDSAVVIVAAFLPNITNIPSILIFHVNVLLNIVAIHVCQVDYLKRLFPFCVKKKNRNVQVTGVALTVSAKIDKI